MKEKFAQPSKSIEILWSCLSENVHFLLIILTALLFKNSSTICSTIKKYWYIITMRVWKLSFLFMFLTAVTFKKSDIFAGIYTLYLSEKRILEQTWQILNTKFASQWKDWKSSYQERHISALFQISYCNFRSKISERT